MDDIICKCTRCRNVHKESERWESNPDRNGVRTSRCPKCGGKSYCRVDCVEQREDGV